MAVDSVHPLILLLLLLLLHHCEICRSDCAAFDAHYLSAYAERPLSIVRLSRLHVYTEREREIKERIREQKKADLKQLEKVILRRRLNFEII